MIQNGYRVFGIDNAHIVRFTQGPSDRSHSRHDHLHRGETVRPYIYRNADTLIGDFWRGVATILKEAGVE
jgi:hypothetical protein